MRRIWEQDRAPDLDLTHNGNAPVCESLARQDMPVKVIRDWPSSGLLGQDRDDNLWIRQLGLESLSPTQTLKADVLTENRNIGSVISELAILPSPDTRTRQVRLCDPTTDRYGMGHCGRLVARKQPRGICWPTDPRSEYCGLIYVTSKASMGRLQLEINSWGFTVTRSWV
jgi:hypothetical protein